MLSYLVSSSRSIQIHSDCLHSKSATSAPILPPPRAHTLSLSLSSLLSPSFRANPYSSSQFRDLESSRQKSPPGHIGTSKAPDRNPPGAHRDLESSRQKPPRGVSGPRKFSTETPGGLSGPRSIHDLKRGSSHVFPPFSSFRDLETVFIGPNNYSSSIHTSIFNVPSIYYCINIITHVYIQIGFYFIF
jgi:hypothetical protein